MPTLIELAERCEQAKGPDRELDTAIWDAVYPGEREERWQEWLRVSPTSMTHNLGPADRDGYIRPRHAYTESLDAAMTLVPDGLGVLVEQQTDEWLVTLWSDAFTPVAESHAITEPLARTAAALRARASQQTTEG